MKKVILLLCLLGLGHMATAQKTIRGKVYEQDDHYPQKEHRFVECSSYNVRIKKYKLSKKGIRIAKGKAAGFELTLSKEQLRKYRYIEFGNGWASTYRILKIKNIGSDSIDVILRTLNLNEDEEENVTVYKPVIYLYPEQETNVSITHTFKGTVLNTFPEYKGIQSLQWQNTETCRSSPYRKHRVMALHW